MNKLIKDTGFLNEAGEKFIFKFKSHLEYLFRCPEIKEMTENELRTFGAVIVGIVNNSITKHICIHNAVMKELNSMTDDQFTSYLKDKYGKDYMLVSLTKEEFERVK